MLIPFISSQWHRTDAIPIDCIFCSDGGALVTRYIFDSFRVC